MSTLLKLTREVKGIRAENYTGKINLLLPHEHPVGKLFTADMPDGKAIYAQCVIKDDVVTLRNPVKAARWAAQAHKRELATRCNCKEL